MLCTNSVMSQHCQFDSPYLFYSQVLSLISKMWYNASFILRALHGFLGQKHGCQCLLVWELFCSLLWWSKLTRRLVGVLLYVSTWTYNIFLTRGSNQTLCEFFDYTLKLSKENYQRGISWPQVLASEKKWSVKYVALVEDKINWFPLPWMFLCIIRFFMLEYRRELSLVCFNHCDSSTN